MQKSATIARKRDRPKEMEDTFKEYLVLYQGGLSKWKKHMLWSFERRNTSRSMKANKNRNVLNQVKTAR